AGSSLRGRFTARLTAASGTPSPGMPSNPFGGGPPANPLGGGGPLTNPFGGGTPANPLGSGSTGSGLSNPFTGTPVGNGRATTNLPGGGGAPVPLEMNGAFGGPTAPAVLVERDPVALVAM